ncbi:MAG: MBL fold metallo-hydrolase [Candidatus Woykebacteria bacterium]
MDITFLDNSSFRIKGKTAVVILDPYEDLNGKKFPKQTADIVTVSHDHEGHNAYLSVDGDPIVLTGPGEYEIKEIKAVGVPSFHDEKEGKSHGKNTIFNMKIDGLSVCHLGSFGQGELTTSQMETIGNVDILLIPTGGVDTMDAATATKIISELEPKIVIPMHYLEAVGQKNKVGRAELEPVENFLKEMGSEKAQPQDKLTISKEKLPEELQVVLLQGKG